MGDSGRTTEYQGDEKLWRIDHGGAASWIVAEQAWEALRELLSIEDDDCEDYKVVVVPPNAFVTVNGEDPKDYPENFRDLEDDDPDAPLLFKATAAEWVEHVVEGTKHSTYYLCGTEY